MHLEKFGRLGICSILASLQLMLAQSCATSKNLKEPSQLSNRPYHRELWIEDFRQLQSFMSSGYPNLVWQRDELKLNLPLLSQKTVSELRDATSEEQAKQILSRFLSAFQDSHLTIKRPASIPPVKQFSKADEGTLVCQSLGMKNKDNSFRFTPDSSFQKLSKSEQPFRYGIARTKNGPMGVLRIGSFAVQDYEAICVEEWNRYRAKIKDSNSCNGECMDLFTRDVMENRLLAEVKSALTELQKKHIKALLLDLSHNGGGSDWEKAVRSMFVAHPIKCGTRGFIRHPHWVKILEETRQELNELLEKAKTDYEASHIKNKIVDTENDLLEAKKTCDLSSIWNDSDFKPQCSIVVEEHVDTCSVTNIYRFTPGYYVGPLFIFVDGHTASASEDLVARLQDNHLATVIGEQTRGSGCGFTNGGVSYVLKNSGLQVKISDCARFRVDGKNEVSGIKPDIIMGLENVKAPEFFTNLTTLISSKMK